MIPVFIGYDTREVVAWHVLAHSILRRSSEPVSITPVGMSTLPHSVWWREKGPLDSTQFSNARFAVPAMMGYQGWAVFMDCDMTCYDDIASLWAQRNDDYAVMVVKHAHKPTEKRKFLGAPQTAYPFKNWSSLMMFNCAHPHTRSLTLDYINSAPGLDLHGFAWTTPEHIGELSGLWNVLTTGPTSCQHPELATSFHEPKPSLLHYTRGGPWHGVMDYGAKLWGIELDHLLTAGNPAARSLRGDLSDGVYISVDYRHET